MRRLLLISLAALLALAACDSTELTGTIGAPEPQAVPVVAVADPQARPTLIAALEASGAAGRFTRVGAANGAETWRAPDGSALVLRDGLLVATYALGFDLYSADVSETAAILASGRAGEATRVHRSLDGENQIVLRSFMCRLSAPVSVRGGWLVTETCAGSLSSFENTYLSDRPGGAPKSSRQWIGPVAGHLVINPQPAPPRAVVAVPVQNSGDDR